MRNNKGFAISGAVYPILILTIFLIMQLLSTLQSRKIILDNIKNDLIDYVNSGNIANRVAAEVIKDKNTNGNAEGLITDDSGNIRYSGSSTKVKNYVTFNNETWRIIGVFNGKLKIVRDESIGNMSWDTKNSDGINNWPTSDIAVYLNGDYFNDLRTLSRKMISEEKYYLGGLSSFSLLERKTIYYTERGAKVYTGCVIGTSGETSETCPRATTWTGNIALPYLSDLIYAGDSTYCKIGSYYSTDCINNNWMYKFSQNMLSIYSENAYGVWSVYSDGTIARGNQPNRKIGTRPTLYLKKNVMIKGGNGSSYNPYQLEL